MVDDNRDAADSLASVLQSLGYETRVAYGGSGALAEVHSSVLQVVLLDIGLPDVDGYAVARQIRAAPGGQALLLVAVTGWAQQADREAAAAAGFDHHLAKPVDMQTLLQLLSAFEKGKRGGARRTEADTPSRQAPARARPPPSDPEVGSMAPEHAKGASG